MECREKKCRNIFFLLQKPNRTEITNKKALRFAILFKFLFP